MLVFVDESGDPGMDLSKGASAYFVVTAVLFEDHDEAKACDQKIDHIRKELGLSEWAEFHFNKSRLYGPGFQYKASFYKYTVNLVFQNAKPHLQEAIVVLDRSGGLEFRKQLATYLKKQLNEKGGPSLIKRVKTERSHTNNLIQLADMVCGAVARSFRTDKADHTVYRRIVQHRELKVQVWPR